MRATREYRQNVAQCRVITSFDCAHVSQVVDVWTNNDDAQQQIQLVTIIVHYINNK